jgi:hypothetical protein
VRVRADHELVGPDLHPALDETVELGERFSGQMLIAGNAAFAMMWGVGGIAVPPLAGTAMDVFGAPGLPLVLGAVCLLLAVLSIARGRDA